MAVQVNDIYKDVSGVKSLEQITVTIALSEYRSLIEENARLLYDNEMLSIDNARLKGKVGGVE